LAVAEGVLSVSLTSSPATSSSMGTTAEGEGKQQRQEGSSLRLLAIRAIDPPSRLTTAGVPDAENSATGGSTPQVGVGGVGATGVVGLKEGKAGGQAGAGVNGMWYPPRGGMKRALIGRVVEMYLKKGGGGRGGSCGVGEVGGWIGVRGRGEAPGIYEKVWGRDVAGGGNLDGVMWWERAA